MQDFEKTGLCDEIWLCSCLKLPMGSSQFVFMGKNSLQSRMGSTAAKFIWIPLMCFIHKVHLNDILLKDANIVYVRLNSNHVSFGLSLTLNDFILKILKWTKNWADVRKEHYDTRKFFERINWTNKIPWNFGDLKFLGLQVSNFGGNSDF